MAYPGYPPYPALFIEGPCHLRRQMIERVAPYYRIPMVTPISLSKTNNTHYKVAVYALYDSWPIKYIFERYEYE